MDILALFSVLRRKHSLFLPIKYTVEYNVDICVLGFYKCCLPVGRNTSGFDTPAPPEAVPLLQID